MDAALYLAIPQGVLYFPVGDQSYLGFSHDHAQDVQGLGSRARGLGEGSLSSPHNV